MTSRDWKWAAEPKDPIMLEDPEITALKAELNRTYALWVKDRDELHELRKALDGAKKTAPGRETRVKRVAMQVIAFSFVVVMAHFAASLTSALIQLVAAYGMNAVPPEWIHRTTMIVALPLWFAAIVLAAKEARKKEEQSK